MVTLCPDCGSKVVKGKCACGFTEKTPAVVKPATEGRASGREWHGIKLCEWSTASGLCGMLSNNGNREPLCGWHRFWRERLSRDGGVAGMEALQVFKEWLQRFQPGGTYAKNHGQWWADADLLWDVMNGLRDAPMLTDELERELHIRYADAQRRALGLAVYNWQGIPRLSGLPLPQVQP